VVENPFADEATVRRDPGTPAANGTGKVLAAVPNPPLLTAAPAERMEPVREQTEQSQVVDERSWEATVSRDVLVGKQLGDFVVKRRIGAGGMGIVYEGEHPIIGRKVAIKILRPEFSEGGAARDLIAEARAASAVRHRGIIDIFGFGTIPHVGQYLVMEYLEGTPLDELISQRAPMLEAEVITLLDELLAALGAAHAKGVIHRDLKPGNIFVVMDSGGGESVKVLDFGLAKRSEVPNGTSPQTRASMIVGTPEYMAPEQATGQEVGPHTDLYSVGVIAFEMLTRRLPFEGPSAMSIAIQHVQAKPPAPSSFVDLHPALDALVLRLLAKTAAQRYPSADAVRRELKAISRQLSDDSTRLEPAPRGEKPSDEAPSVRAEPSSAASTSRPPRHSRPEAPESVTVTRKEAPSFGAEPVTNVNEDPRQAGSSPVSTDRVPVVRANRVPQLAVGAVVLLALGALGVWALRSGETPVPVPPPVVETPSTQGTDPVAPTNPPQAVKPVPPPAVEPQVPVTPPTAVVEPQGPVTPPLPVETPKPPPDGPSAAKIAQQNPGSSQTTPKKPGNTTRVKKTGTLRLMPPHWAQVYVDDEYKGDLPKAQDLELPVGRHKLRVEKKGFKTLHATITITDDGLTEHRLTWEKAEAP
jgi:serine/threonine-protein kinase